MTCALRQMALHSMGVVMPVGDDARSMPRDAVIRLHSQRRSRGFTLVELLVVLVVLAVLASLIAPNYLNRVDDARDTVLKHNLLGLREAIDQFNRDKGRYPTRLPELVEHRYIRAVPVDPVTGRDDTWIPIAPSGGPKDAVSDVKSGAQGPAQDGSDYGSW